MTTSIYWFTHDLRLDDNAILHQLQSSDSLICLYCVDPKWFKPWRYHVAQMSAIKWQFLQDCLKDLNNQLKNLGQELFIAYQSPEQVIPSLVDTYSVDKLYVCRQFGYDERRVISDIEQKRDQLIIHEIDQSTLFKASDMELGFPKLTSGFSPFKNKALMNLDAIPLPLPKPTQLPGKPLELVAAKPDHINTTAPDYLPQTSNVSALLQGGEFIAQRHLLDYFSSNAIERYKQTRNQLDGFDNSTKFSAWLNTGSLSVRRVYDQICHYEQNRIRNDSTQWLVFELLWREYFHWLSLNQSSKLFSFKGLSKSPPLTGYYAERFQKWSHGNTQWPLVNACMRELKHTGYLSNRGRQIAASCFVNELQLDWRFGAAWFEHCLIDYQVSVNWGNWQYIAGVGVDPRGGRHMKLEKQQQLYDPDHKYINAWCAQEDFSKQAYDSIDASDWPQL